MAKEQVAFGLEVGGQSFTCLACKQGTRFVQREVKMNTTGLSALNLDWANKAADGAICEACGFVHTFMGDQHRWV